MDGLVWLASYPKSGNTWVRAFWAAYLDQSDDVFDLRKIEAVTVSDSKWALFTAVSGKQPEQIDNEEVNALRAAVQKRLVSSMAPSQLVKTHNARFTDDGYPLVRADCTRGAVYVVRNPLDVVDSLSDHASLSLDQTIALLNNPNHRLRRDARLASQYVGTWSAHVLSWIDYDDFPVLVLRYEDLCEQPMAAFGRLVEFLGHPPDDERLGRAIERSSFGALSALEEQTGFAETSPKSRSGRFFRRGRARFWQNVLSPRQVRTVLDHHGQVMEKLNYAFRRGDDVVAE